MKDSKQPNQLSRRSFVKNTLTASMGIMIIPRFVMGGKGYIAPSDKITLGFIGTGKQARGLVRGFAPKAQVLAGADVDSKKLVLFRQITEKLYADAKEQTQYKGFTSYADFQELLERKDIDAVVIATPDHWHAVQSVMAANAKKHVYCEKPLAHSIEEGRAMVKAMKRNDVILQTGSMQRSQKNFRHACELVRNGYLGDIKEVLVSVGKAGIPCDLPEQAIPAELNWPQWVGPAALRPFNAVLAPPVQEDIFPNWRNYKEFGGGMLSDWGAHMFDIAQWALDKDKSGPVRLFPPDGKEYKTLTMLYDNGVVVKHEDFGRGNAVRFIGSKGSLDVSRSFIDSKPENIALSVIQSNEIHLYNSENHHQDWLDAIKSGKPPICDAETGHRTSSVCCLGNIAYWLKRPLKWNPKRERFIGDREANALAKANLQHGWKLK